MGRYEIRSQIGAGGMGEVYRARDTKLERDVAVKVLPAIYSQDAERLQRFEQEAQAAGSLNHPNILAVYDVGEHVGAPYVVSELLEGETLRERLTGAPLSQRKAIEYASQLARGLSAAHARGIIHRDLKPENIFITQDGQVKILDFGLAKLITPASVEAQTDVPTRRVNTDPGTVMGTVGYMSPEQVRGRPADHRSDIFSFGAVLYEMLSGKRAFRGDSAADTISAILKEDPPDLSETNKNISPTLERVVRRCLEKNPTERFQSASDLAFDLENIYGTSSQSTTSTLAAIPETAKRRRWPLWTIGALVLVIAGVFTAGFFIGRRTSVATPPVYQQLTFRRGTIRNAKFAPDGQTIIYSAEWNGNPSEIFAMRAGSAEARSLGLKNADVLSVSASGELAVLLNRHYLSQSVSRGTLARMPIDGGTPREILEDVQEADWSPDGTKLAIVRWVNGRNRLEYPIGKVLYETSGYLSWPRVSPKGDMVAFMEHQIKYDDRGWVVVVDLNGNKKTLTNEWGGEEGLAWMPSGDEILFGAQAGQAGTDALYAVTTSGRQRVVERGPSAFWLPFDIYRDGRVLLTREDGRSDIFGLAPGETKERDLSWLDNVSIRDLSADGRTFTMSSWTEGSNLNYDSYLGKTDGTPPVKLGEGDPWALSPDGRWVLTLIYTPSQLVLLPTGAGETRRLEIPGIETFGRALRWFPDGKRILFNGKEPGHTWRMYVYEIDGGNPPRAITPEGVVGSLISPDAQSFIASDPQGVRYIYPINGGEARPIPGINDDREKVVGWSSDGHSVYVQRYDELPIRVFRVDIVTGRREAFKEITPADPAGIDESVIRLTPDGKSYLYQLGRELSTLYLVDGLK